jgi:hypothetical protein
MRKGVVYYIESAATGRIYIGSTVRGQKQRWSEHLHHLRNGTHHCRHLQHVYAKYSEADLTCRVVETVDDELFLLAREQFHLWRHEGHIMNGVPVSDAVYAAHAANRGRTMAEEERAKRSESAKLAIAEGRAKRGPWDAERKARHSERLTGRKMPPVSAETCSNISNALRAYHARNGTTAKPPKGGKMWFIKDELPVWLEMKASGKSYREIERITGRCRSFVARECKKALAA